jgi:dienelactone hydrolase
MRIAILTAIGLMAPWGGIIATAHAAVIADKVEFGGEGITLKATLYKPDGPGPFPVVIGMHGCDGLINAAGNPFARYREWAERLSHAGFAMLYPDSFGSRGIGNQCRSPTSARTAQAHMADAYAARKWLLTQPFVKRQNISLIGWANGGVSVLWAVRPNSKARDTEPDFRSAVAFYPGCNRLDRTAWSARIPTMILIGNADDVVSARVCEKMIAGARGRSARATIVIYPGAHHDFDQPNRSVQTHTGYAFSVDGSGRVHTGINPAARADAFKRVPRWLER